MSRQKRLVFLLGVGLVLSFPAFAINFSEVNPEYLSGLIESAAPSLPIDNTIEIPVRLHPYFIITSRNGKLYVANRDSQSISVIQGKYLKKTLSLPFKPYKILLGRNNKLYVTSGYLSRSVVSSRVAVINENTGIVEKNLILGESALDLIEAQNDKIYVTNSVDGTVVVIDEATDTILGRIMVGRTPVALIESQGGKIYVANYSNDTISVIDETNNNIKENIIVGDGPSELIESQNGKIYVLNDRNLTISIIDETSNFVEKTIFLRHTPITFIQSRNGKIYVANNNDTVSIINEYTNHIEATIPVGRTPVALIESQGGKIYVANQGDNTVSVINEETNTVERIVPVGKGPSFFSMSLDNYIYVANNLSNSVSMLLKYYPSISGITTDSHFPKKTYFFFSNGTYARFDDDSDTIDPGYPKLTATSWGMTEKQAINISGIIKYSRHPGKIYFFFKDGLYSRFDEAQDRMEPGYPYDTAAQWKMTTEQAKNIIGITPDSHFPKKTYFFFSNGTYARFDDDNDNWDPGYPKPTATSWGMTKQH